MKNILKNSLGFMFLCHVTFLNSCSKNKTTTPIGDPAPVTTNIANGLPENTKKINGYLYAGNVINLYSAGTQSYVLLYAIFGDPTRNLMGNYDHFTNLQKNTSNINDRSNISVGKLSFNGETVTSSGNLLYTQNSNSSNSLNYSSNWSSDGNLSFKPLNVSIARGIPVIHPPSTTITYSYSIEKNKGFTINFADFISNYDSVCVVIYDYSSTLNGYKIRKTISSASNSITFSQAEISVLNTTPLGNINFIAYNYSNKIIEDKIYVFELSNRLNMALVISQ